MSGLRVFKFLKVLYSVSKKVWVDRLNSWKAGLNGIVTINMTLILLKQKVSVQLQLDKSSGQVQYRG